MQVSKDMYLSFLFFCIYVEQQERRKMRGVGGRERERGGERGRYFSKYHPHANIHS
jgi:hypothetical protein